jgi:NhaP-type Na+/H+ or K+/H+ antiporter
MVETNAAGAIIIFIVLMIYMVVGALLEKYHAPFGHEAGVVIVVGAAISLLAYYLGHHEFIEMMEFDETFFFYFCLPPIVFASGFNMKRKKFFENFHNVIIFGVFNTIV